MFQFIPSSPQHHYAHSAVWLSCSFIRMLKLLSTVTLLSVPPLSTADVTLSTYSKIAAGQDCSASLALQQSGSCL